MDGQYQLLLFPEINTGIINTFNSLNDFV